MTNVQKRIFVNKQQKEALIEYMENNPILKNTPKLNNNISKKSINQKWEDLAIHLNKIGEVTGGAIKDSITWKKTWHDLRCNIKKKVSQTRRYQMGTGGGPPLTETGDDYENKIINILDPMEIEGDSNISESQVVFEIVDEPNEQLLPECAEQNGHDSSKEPDGPDSSKQSDGPDSLKQKSSVGISKSKRLLETLQVSNKISKEIEIKTDLKKEYYKEKIKILKENTLIKKEKLELKRQDVATKKDISASLKLITEYLTTSINPQILFERME